jgi:hypothetical protein
MKKWDRRTHIYENFIPPDGEYILVADEMDQLTTCPHCGKKVKYGETYTSKEIYTDNGIFGYPVCEKCYEKEWNRIREERIRK